MKRVILIAGETSRGKDTLANTLADFGLRSVCSYTTRPKRTNETDGVEHYFITEKEAEDLLHDKDKIIAYTEIGGIKYFATADELIKSDLYIIDPKGIKYLLQKEYPDIEFHIVYVTCSYGVAEKRAKQRGDDLNVFRERSEAEYAQFKEFSSKHQYDEKFYNGGSLDDLKSFASHLYRDFFKGGV